MHSVSMAQSPADQSELRGILQQQEAAWNRGDGSAWASAFSDDADFINIRGAVFHGRTLIAQRHAQIFSGPYQGSHSKITIRQLTEIAPGVALIETEHEITGYKFLPPGIAPTSEGVLRTLMKYVAVKQGGQWHLVAAQNTPILPDPPVPQ